MAATCLDLTACKPFLGGKSFGATGACEVLRGTVTFAVDPPAPAPSRHYRSRRGCATGYLAL